MGADGIAVGGTLNVTQLAQRGIRSVCLVDGLGAGGGGQFPLGTPLMFIGHSFVTANNYTFPVRESPPQSRVASRTIGDAAWTRSLDQRFNVDTWADINAPYKAGISGNDVSGAANGFSGASMGVLYNDPSILDYFIARMQGTGCIWFILGTNDITSNSITLSDMLTQYAFIRDRVKAAGIKVGWDTIYPRRSTAVAGTPATNALIPDGDARLTKQAAFNAQLVADGAAGLIYCNDLRTLLGDPRPTQDYWLSNDDLHPQGRGVYVASANRLPILQSLYAPGDFYDIDPRNGNALPNPQMAGTGGTKAGAGAAQISGNVPTGYTVTNNNVSLVNCTIFDTSISGYKGLQLDITPVVDGTPIHEVRFTLAANTLFSALPIVPVADEWWQFMQHVETSGLQISQFSATPATGSSSATLWDVAIDQNLSNSLYLEDPTAKNREMIGEKFKIVSGTDRLRNGGTNYGAIRFPNTSPPGTIKIYWPIFRKVTDPRPRFNLPLP